MFRAHTVEQNVPNKEYELGVNLDSYKYKNNIVFVHFELVIYMTMCYDIENSALKMFSC